MLFARKLVQGGMASILSALQPRVSSALRSNLSSGTDGMRSIFLSMCFLRTWTSKMAAVPRTQPLSRLIVPGRVHKSSRRDQESIDIVGSASCALLLLSPLSRRRLRSAIKLTSKGPILFKQQRLGQYGARFTFLKFRSMYFQNDSKIHRDYVRQLISGEG